MSESTNLQGQLTKRLMAAIDYIDVKTATNGAERAVEYTSLPSEAQLDLNRIPSNRPENGEIRPKNVNMRYRPGLPLALSNFNLNITGEECISIVVRKGAGKRSVFSTLFLMVELVSTGKASIDGVDVLTIGLRELRSKLAIIPREPTLYKDTVRSNLDPLGAYNDLVLCSVLRQSSLIPFYPSSDSTTDEAHDTLPTFQNRVALDSLVAEEGQNFSLGQRQLFALIRALIRDSDITVIDDGASFVDRDTDRKVQSTITNGFKGKVILSFTHRLHPILNYDCICIMDKGEIVESGSPKNTVAGRRHFFRAYVRQSGIGNKHYEDQLLRQELSCTGSAFGNK